MDGGTDSASFPAPAVTVDISDPRGVANAFIHEWAHNTGDGTCNLYFWNGDFRAHDGCRYVVIPGDELRAKIYEWLASKSSSENRPIKPNKRLVDNVIDALKSAAYLSISEAPAWVDFRGCAYLPRDLIACANGLLHVPTRDLVEPTPRFFVLNSVEFAYDPAAPRPCVWLSFLDALWPNDRTSIETLQEIFGYCLTLDTSQQKAFAIVGPLRSGKGTIGRVFTNLVGLANVTAPGLASIGREFGMQSFIGKTLALISDARLGGRADLATIVENILRITGEDTVSIPRKFREDWTARLNVRFLLLSNELPAFLDHSGALAGRFILLRLTRSFFGEEDHDLGNRLLLELPGILLWALDGLERLRKRGYFRQPDSSRELMAQFEMLTSPVKAFIAECCIAGEPGADVSVADLFNAWADWCKEQGRHNAGTHAMLGRNLSSALPHLKIVRKRDDAGKRTRVYAGIRLRTITDPESSSDDSEQVASHDPAT